MTSQEALKVEYEKYIKSVQWRQKADAALKRSGEKCERCGFSKWSKKLEVHHLTYERFKNERPEDLVVLCKDCHEKADSERRKQTQAKQARRLYDARLDGWATRKYGEDWIDYHDSDSVRENFDRWLENHE